MNETRMLTDAEINAYQKGIERGRAMHRPDRGRNCGTCDFWQPTDHDVMKPTPWPGTCRKASPTVTGFPAMTNEDWCAEYEAAPGCDAET